MTSYLTPLRPVCVCVSAHARAHQKIVLESTLLNLLKWTSNGNISDGMTSGWGRHLGTSLAQVRFCCASHYFSIRGAGPGPLRPLRRLLVDITWARGHARLLWKAAGQGTGSLIVALVSAVVTKAGFSKSSFPLSFVMQCFHCPFPPLGWFLSFKCLLLMSMKDLLFSVKSPPC